MMLTYVNLTVAARTRSVTWKDSGRVANGLTIEGPVTWQVGLGHAFVRYRFTG